MTDADLEDLLDELLSSDDEGQEADVRLESKRSEPPKDTASANDERLSNGINPAAAQQSTPRNGNGLPQTPVASMVEREPNEEQLLSKDSQASSNLTRPSKSHSRPEERAVSVHPTAVSAAFEASQATQLANPSESHSSDGAALGKSPGSLESGGLETLSISTSDAEDAGAFDGQTFDPPVPSSIFLEGVTERSGLGELEDLTASTDGAVDSAAVAAEIAREAQTASSVLPRHIAELEMAEELERALATGQGIQGLEGIEGPADPIDSLRLRLQWAREEWQAEGQPDGRGGLVGGELLVRADLVGPIEEALSKHSGLGRARSVAVFRSAVAVGTSSGVCFVLMPRSRAAGGQPEVLLLGQSRAQEEAAATSVTFSLQGNVLLVGHADGDLNFWELRKSGWECVKSFKDVHSHPVAQAAFLEGPQMTAVTADSRGRLVHHNVTSYLSLTAMFAGRLTKAAQPTVLTDGRQLGPLCFLTGLSPPRTGSPAAGDVGRSILLQEPSLLPALEGMVLICSSRGAFVGRVGPDGRLGILHNIPKPTDAREGCLPYAAWRLLPTENSARLAYAHLVMGWERKLFLMEVPFPIAMPDSNGQPTEKLAVRLMHRWEADLPVVALHWVEGPAIAAAIQEGPHAFFCLYSATGEMRREFLALGDPLLHHSDLVGGNAAPEACHHSASAASFGGVLLLGSQGIRMVRLMSWQERLASLRDISQFELSLLVGLDVLQAAAESAGGGATHLWRAEGKGADLQQVANVLTKLLGGYLVAALPAAEVTGAASQMRAAAAADVAIELCLATDTRSMLWSDVFPRFAAAGCSAMLLERILPHILSDQLTALAPEVMQELVEHCAKEGRPQAVEAAVMHMDIASLDLNQVVRLCRQHHLFSALAFLFPRALLDFVAPAAELAAAIAYSEEGNPGESPSAGPSLRKRLAFKLLVYLRTAFRGRVFPPGGGDLEGRQAAETKAQLLGFLVFATPRFIGQLLEGFGVDESPGSVAALEDLLPGPHPVLRCLVSIDAGATLLVLREALLGCTLTEAALRGDSQSVGSETDEQLAEQTILNAVVALLDVGAFRRSQPGENSAADPTGEEDGVLHALEFISDAVAEGRVTAAAAVVLKLLEWLVVGPWRGGEPPPREQREQQFMALLQHLDLRRRGREGGNPGGSEAVAAQSLATQAGFLKAQAQVQHLAGNHAAALRCFLQTSSAAAFDYLEAALGSPNTSREEAGDIWRAMAGVSADLVRADSLAFARLVLERFPDKHKLVVSGLRQSPELQFRYLKGVVRVGKEKEGGVLATGKPSRVLLPLDGGSLNTEAEAEASELYIRLLCQFEPEAVLPFLQGYETYRVQEVLPFCERYGVSDAQAFLLERLGDVSAALDIYVSRLGASTKTLVAAVLARKVAAEKLSEIANPRVSHSRLLGSRPALQKHADLPPELPAAVAALKAAVALCQRQSRDASPQVAQQLWMAVLRVLAAQLRLLLREHPMQQPAARPKRALSIKASLSGGSREEQLRSLQEAAAVHQQAEEAAAVEEEVEPVPAVRRLLMRFMEGVIADMAGFVPLATIGDRLLEEFGSDRFGDFRGSLVGLLAAYNYELEILQAANRLMSSDAFHVMFSVYRGHTRSTPAEPVRHPTAAAAEADLSAEASSSSTAESASLQPSSQRQSATSRSMASTTSRPVHAHAAHSGEGQSLPGRSSAFGPIAKITTRPGWGGREGPAESTSPIHRSGCDINFLRDHGLNSMAAGE